MKTYWGDGNLAPFHKDIHRFLLPKKLRETDLKPFISNVRVLEIDRIAYLAFVFKDETGNANGILYRNGLETNCSHKSLDNGTASFFCVGNQDYPLLVNLVRVFSSPIEIVAHHHTHNLPLNAVAVSIFPGTVCSSLKKILEMFPNATPELCFAEDLQGRLLDMKAASVINNSKVEMTIRKGRIVLSKNNATKEFPLTMAGITLWSSFADRKQKRRFRINKPSKKHSTFLNGIAS